MSITFQTKDVEEIVNDLLDFTEKLRLFKDKESQVSQAFNVVRWMRRSFDTALFSDYNVQELFDPAINSILPSQLANIVRAVFESRCTHASAYLLLYRLEDDMRTYFKAHAIPFSHTNADEQSFLTPSFLREACGKEMEEYVRKSLHAFLLEQEREDSGEIIERGISEGKKNRLGVLIPRVVLETVAEELVVKRYFALFASIPHRDPTAEELAGQYYAVLSSLERAVDFRAPYVLIETSFTSRQDILQERMPKERYARELTRYKEIIEALPILPAN